MPRRRIVVVVTVVLAQVCACKRALRGPSDGGAADAGSRDASVATANADAQAPRDAGPDARALAEAAARARVLATIEDLKWMVEHHASVNPAKAGEGDISTKCDAVQSELARPIEDPDTRALLDGAAALCAFDVPLLQASEALDHLRFGTSQASHALMCNVARVELDKARAVKPRDGKLRALDARRATACK
jgi:hypothetical protein